jgi:RNA polymerase sigma-70 factor (ECF subfamily)
LGFNGNANGVPHLERLTDEELIARLAQGEAAAFGQFYERYSKKVFGYALSILRNRADAEDACSEIFVAIASSAATYAGTGSGRGWLYTVARNRIMQLAKQRGRLQPTDPAALDAMREKTEEPAGLAPPEYEVVEDPDLNNLIKCLPRAQREVVVLEYLCCLDTNEIAGLIERTPKAVERLHERSIDLFRRRLEALGRDAASFRREWSRGRVRWAPVTRSRRFALKGPALGGGAFTRPAPTWSQVPPGLGRF